MIYYFIGIKGSGMSSLASVMHDLGYNVMGSDKEDHFFTQIGLEERNITMLPFNKDNIKEGMIVVQGNAFGDENEEVRRAKELGLTIYTYQEMIAKLTDDTKLIAISGCHGKTSTTTMTAKIFENIGIYRQLYIKEKDMYKLIDGKSIAQKIRQELRGEVEDKKLTPQEFLVKYVNEECGLLYHCVSVTLK